MKRILFAIGSITLMIVASTISLGTSSKPAIEQKMEDETTTFRFAAVRFALNNVTEFEYTRIFGGKLLKNGLYSNIKISGEYFEEGGTIVGLFPFKSWDPKRGDLVTVEIGRFIGRFYNGTYHGVPYIGLSGGNNGGWGFDIKATIHQAP